jgi:hypothetical protein
MSRITAVLSITIFTTFILFGNFIVQSQRPEPPTQPSQGIKPLVASPTKQTLRSQRIREGTTFKDMLVFFRQNGDRTVLYTADDNHRFTCLENLALERVLTALQEKPERQFWKVDGEFSEFRGENFVSIRRFVVARTPTDTAP